MLQWAIMNVLEINEKNRSLHQRNRKFKEEWNGNITLKNTVSETKNSVNGPNLRLNTAEEASSKDEDGTVEIIKTETKRDKSVKKEEKNLSELWVSVKESNM